MNILVVLAGESVPVDDFVWVSAHFCGSQATPLTRRVHLKNWHISEETTWKPTSARASRHVLANFLVWSFPPFVFPGKRSMELPKVGSPGKPLRGRMGASARVA